MITIQVSDGYYQLFLARETSTISRSDDHIKWREEVSNMKLVSKSGTAAQLQSCFDFCDCGPGSVVNKPPPKSTDYDEVAS